MTNNSYVFDACVPIDLFIEKVDCLEYLLNKLNYDKIFISSINYDEIKDIKIKNIIENSTNCFIESVTDDELNDFWNEIMKNRINISKKDAAVILLGNKIKSDFIVSSDWNVIEQTKKYKKWKGITNIMRQIHTIAFLEIMVSKGIINPISHLERGLLLFENKEIDNITNHLIKKSSACHKTKDLEETIRETMGDGKTRFKEYRNSVTKCIKSAII